MFKNRFRNQNKDKIPPAEPKADSAFETRNGVLVRWRSEEEACVIPEGVSQIPKGAFSGYTGLRKVTIPGIKMWHSYSHLDKRINQKRWDEQRAEAARKVKEKYGK